MCNRRIAVLLPTGTGVALTRAKIYVTEITFLRPPTICMRWGHFSLCSLLLGMPRRQLFKMHGDIGTQEPFGMESWEARCLLRPAGRVQKKTAGSRRENRTRDLPRQRAQFKRLAELGSGRIVEPEVKPSPARPQRHLQASRRAGRH